MIDHFTASTSNGWKVSLVLEKLELPHTAHPLNLSEGQQKEACYLQINPSGSVPAIIDRNEGDSPSSSLVDEGD